MKRITITALHLKHGGVEKVIVSMANLFCEMGYEINIMCTYNLGAPAYEINSKVNVRYLTEYQPNRREVIQSLRNFKLGSFLKESLKSLRILNAKKKSMIAGIKAIESGIVISTRHESTMLLSKYGNKGVYKIGQLHHDHKFKKKIIKDFQTKYANIDQFLLLNDTLTNEVKEMMKGYNNHTICKTVPNFLENDLAEKNISKNDTIIAVGRLHSDKAFDRLLSLWKQISLSNPSYTLQIVGDGELKEQLLQITKDNSIESSVEFLGQQSHDVTLELMKQAKMFLMTSISEALPLVLIESMSQGTIPVAYDVRVGPRSIIEDSVDGFLIEDNDVESFVSTVNQYLSEYKLNNEMEMNALTKAEKYTKAIVIEYWREIFQGDIY